jgi:nicotinamide-nucleotide amidase
MLTERPGSSEYFAGSAVVYENRAKTALLGVPEELIRIHGAVSTEVARAMAEGARSRFDVDLAAAVTGIAGPDGGSDEKPVGLVHFAVASARGTVDHHLIFPGDREMVRRRAAHAALLLLRRVLNDEAIGI